MSFTARHRFPAGEGGRYTIGPTSLRSRSNSSPVHPPVSLSPNITNVAQREPSKIPRAAALPNAAPLTPTTSSTENRKKSWVNSASKTLGLKKLCQKTSFTLGHVMNEDSSVPSRTQSTRKLNVRDSVYILSLLTGSIGSRIPQLSW